MSKVAVTVAVMTKNEEKNIELCLKSVHNWADEIIVVDDESTDKTVEIAKKFTDKVFSRKMDNEGKHRNWMYAQSKNEWVFSLDADEQATDELKDEIDQALSHTEFQAYAIPRKNYIGDYWIQYGGLYPSAQLKLFAKSTFKWEEVGVHPMPYLDGKSGHLKGDIIHKSYRDFGHFMTKLNGQTTLEAKKWIETNRNMTFGKALWRTLDRFPRTYFRKKGHKDGFIGFMVAFFASLYQIISYAKYWEMKKKQTQK